MNGKSSTPARTSMPSVPWEKTGIDRLYKRVGKQKVSWIYKHPDGRSETLASAKIGDKQALKTAETTGKRLALDIQQGRIVAGSVAEGIDRFESEIDPDHYADQSKHGKDTRRDSYKNLKLFFGKMSPSALRKIHGYQYLDARAKAGAPARANKEIAQLQTICHHFVRWGLIENNPFTDIMLNVTETVTRTVERRQVVRFYLWAVRQRQNYRTLGCAAMFTYLTGFRAAEVRPFLRSGLTPEGVEVTSAKRKKGEAKVRKLRDWSPRLRTVVQRALQREDAVPSIYLFAPTKRSAAYTRSGWGSSWQDAMGDWIRSIDPTVPPGIVTSHPLYFALQDVRPAAITAKMARRDADVYDFAAHANPATTHAHYDRRRVKRAAATE